MPITLRQLRGFLAAAASGSFSAGATKLGLTQPGFSLLIRQLEAELGVRLFDRTTRRIELTSAGEEFRSKIERVLKDLDEVCRDMRDLADRRRGHVTVGAIASATSGLLPKALRWLGDHYAGIQTTIHEDDAVPLVECVLASEVDFAVGPLVTPHELISLQPILDDPLICVFPENDPVLDAAVLTWRLISQRPYIAIVRQSSVHQVVRDALHIAKVDLEAVYEVRTVPAAISLVKAGLGFAIMPELSLENVAIDGLVKREIVDPPAHRTVGILTKKYKSLTPAAEVVVQALTMVAKARETGSPRRQRLSS
jgi:LysR family carnitine catabolism transcriptional activator